MDTQILKNRWDEQTPQSKQIIRVLYDAADWMTRDQIAQRHNKKRLNPHDMALLDRLTANGFVEAHKRPKPGKIGFEFIYRLDGDVHRTFNRLSQFRREKA
jgi:hypothetical protein